MIHKKNEEDTTCETTRVWVVLVRGVACWWDGVGELGNIMGPYTQPIVPIFTIPLLKGQPQCLSFYPSRLQHRPHHFLRAPYGQKRREWQRCARSKSMFSCLCNSYVCLCLSVLWFPFSFVFVNLNYQNLHCMLHAIIGFSMCTRVRGAFICLHIYISSVHACMHHQENKIKGSFSTYKKNLRILMQIWMKIFRSFEM